MAQGVDKLVNHMLDCEVLVVGGGSAGLFSAIKARQAGRKVLLVDKGYVGRSGSSPFAAGALNVCLPDDDLDTWLEEIIERGEYLNDQEWVKLQLEEGYDRVAELQEWGKAYAQLIIEEDDQGRYRRRKARGNIKTLTCVMNALPMMDTLRRKASEAGADLVERVMVTHLVMHDGRVVGALGLHTRTGELYLFTARAVVLAAGGCGFKAFFIGHHNLTGEAHAMAYEVGAWLRNLDQAMSNSTARELDIHGLSHMVGSGGRFLNRDGEEFMLRYDPEVGSRARLTKLVIGMAKEVDAGRGPIYMDLTGVTPEDQAMLRRILPEGFRAFERMGIDPFKQRIEWMPAFEGTLAHGGGVHIDTECASTLPGLYAAGDATCTPEHGTWSITGLNLTFCFVSGARSGEFGAKYAGNAGLVEPSQIAEQVTEAVEEVLAPVKRTEGIRSEEIVYRLLENLIPYKIAYLRTESTLKEALENIRQLRQESLSRVSARSIHDLVKANEVRSMLCVAEMILASVLFRQESRGFVYREDFPDTDNINWLKWVMVGKGEEGVKVWAEEFPTPYVKAPREVYSPFGGERP